MKESYSFALKLSCSTQIMLDFPFLSILFSVPSVWAIIYLLSIYCFFQFKPSLSRHIRFSHETGPHFWNTECLNNCMNLVSDLRKATLLREQIAI